MHEPRTVEEGSWRRWVIEGSRGMMSAPGNVLAVVAVATALAFLKVSTDGYVEIMITGTATMPVMALLMRLALVSNGLETGVVSARFIRAMLIETAIVFVSARRGHSAR